MSINQDLAVIKSQLNLPQFAAEFHLRIVYKVWYDYYKMGIQRNSKIATTLRCGPKIFNGQFDYPKYLRFLKTKMNRDLLTDIEFDDGELFVPYKHNIPAKDFFKVRVSFFKVGKFAKREVIHRSSIARFVSLENASITINITRQFSKLF